MCSPENPPVVRRVPRGTAPRPSDSIRDHLAFSSTTSASWIDPFPSGLLLPVTSQTTFWGQPETNSIESPVKGQLQHNISVGWGLFGCCGGVHLEESVTLARRCNTLRQRSTPQFAIEFSLFLCWFSSSLIRSSSKVSGVTWGGFI